MKTKSKSRTAKANAQLKQALHYVWGTHGFSKSDKMARIWHKKSANNGNVEAMFNLGTMCLEGEGGPVDVNFGLKLLKKAALRKRWHIFSVTAPSLLADIYGEGLFGVKNDAEESKKWKRLSRKRKSEGPVKE